MRKLLIICAVLLPSFAHAAFEATVAPSGDLARVVVMLSSATTSVNAIEGTLVVPHGAKVTKLYTGGSIVMPFLEEPRESGGSIRFAGIIPGGFTGSAIPGGGLSGPGELFSFESSSHGPFRMEDAVVYLNDGNGTRVPVPDEEIRIRLVEGGALQPEDRTPPEYVEAVPLQGGIDGAPALIITGFDDESGIDRYEVQEGSGPWTQASSTYPVKDTSGFLSLSVRAYDRAGNFIETRIEGRNAALAKLVFVGAVLIIFFIIASVLVYFKKRRA